MLLQFLTTFCRVVDEGSFTKAAESLNLSQPTATKQIQRLEAEFGVPLIDRGQRELTLTPAGEVVYVHARRILNTLKKCREALEALKTPGRGDLSIGAVSTIALYTLPAILEKFTEAHPLVTLHVRSGTNKEIVDLVLHNDADVGLTTVPITHEHIITRPLFVDNVILICSPQAAKSNNGTISPTELSSMPMIAYERRSQFRGFVDSSFEAAGISPNIVMEFDNHEAVKTMVQLGLGVAMAPASAVRNDLRHGRLGHLHIAGFPDIGRVTSMIVRRGRPHTKALTDFISLLKALYPSDSLPLDDLSSESA